MKIKMIENKRGSIDGVNINTYLEGAEYDMKESLATVFIKIGVAIEIIEHPKAIISTPEKPIMMETANLKTKHRGRPAGSKNKKRN